MILFGRFTQLNTYKNSFTILLPQIETVVLYRKSHTVKYDNNNVDSNLHETNQMEMLTMNAKRDCWKQEVN